MLNVYVINCDDSDFNFREAEQLGDYDSIKKEAIRTDSVYPLNYFQECINDESLWLNNSFIYIGE